MKRVRSTGQFCGRSEVRSTERSFCEAFVLRGTTVLDCTECRPAKFCEWKIFWWCAFEPIACAEASFFRQPRTRHLQRCWFSKLHIRARKLLRINIGSLEQTRAWWITPQACRNSVTPSSSGQRALSVSRFIVRMKWMSWMKTGVRIVSIWILKCVFSVCAMKEASERSFVCLDDL